MGSKNYRDLDVWRVGMDLVDEIYAITSFFPRAEAYGLTSQMQRAAVSIPSNIAEGSRRGTRKEFRKHIRIASGSTAELDTQLDVVSRRPWSKNISLSRAQSLLQRILQMLNKLEASMC